MIVCGAPRVVEHGRRNTRVTAIRDRQNTAAAGEILTSCGTFSSASRITHAQIHSTENQAFLMSANPNQQPSKNPDQSHGRLSRRQWLFIGAACVVSVCLRLIDSPIANLSSMVALALFCGTAIRHPAGFLLPLAFRLLTDSLIYLKNGYSFFPSWPFDYSAYVLIYLIGLSIPRTSRGRTSRHVLAIAGGTISSILIYFALSNFGVWLMWSETYPHTAAGLMDCFVKAIPFARGTFYGNLLAAPIFYGVWYLFAGTADDPAVSESALTAADKA